MKRKNYLLLFLLLAFGIAIQAQQTIYFDANWAKTTLDKAVYYRPQPKVSGKGYIIEDYYMSGQMQGKGFSTSDTAILFEGLATWYYANGKVMQTANFLNGFNHGEIITYDSLGKETSRGRYSNGQPYEGTFIEENEDTKYLTFAVYKDSAIQSCYIVDCSAKPTKSKIEYTFKDGAMDLVKYYDQNGKYMGSTSSFNENSGVKDGLNVIYSNKPMMVKQIAHLKNGLNISPRKSFYSNGKLKMVEYFKPEGESEYDQPKIAISYYDQKGARMDSLIYKDGSPFNGKQITFFPANNNASEEDQIASITPYANSAIDGELKTFHQNGNLASSANYVENNVHGYYITYDEIGKETNRLLYKLQEPWEGTLEDVSYRTTYKNGKIVFSQELYEDKSVKKETRTVDNISTTKWYSKSKQVLGALVTDSEGNNSGDDVELTDDGNVSQIRTYARGIMIREKHFVDGKLLYDQNSNGTSTFNDLNNNKSYTCTYKENSPVTGTMLEYEYGGTNITAIRSYKDEKQNGEEIDYNFDYDQNKNFISRRAFYIDGELNGAEKTYNKGKIVSSKNYKKEVLEGEAIFYDKNENILSKVTYVNGNPQNGSVYEFDYIQNLTSIKTYKLGALQQVSTVCKFLTDTLLTLTYKNEEPFDGKFLEEYTLYEYKAGKLVKKTEYTNETDGILENERIYNGSNSEKTSYYTDGNVKQKIKFVDDVITGNSISYKANGEILAQGKFVDGQPSSGTFACFSEYESNYFLITIKDKTVKATLYEDGDAVNSFTSSALSEHKPFSDVLNDFFSMLRDKYYNYNFDFSK